MLLYVHYKKIGDFLQIKMELITYLLISSKNRLAMDLFHMWYKYIITYFKTDLIKEY
jgi:hypothetical protein